jgi:hypothetical protein
LTYQTGRSGHARYLQASLPNHVRTETLVQRTPFRLHNGAITLLRKAGYEIRTIGWRWNEKVQNRSKGSLYQFGDVRLKLKKILTANGSQPSCDAALAIPGSGNSSVENYLLCVPLGNDGFIGLSHLADTAQGLLYEVEYVSRSLNPGKGAGVSSLAWCIFSNQQHARCSCVFNALRCHRIFKAAILEVPQLFSWCGRSIK